jgi:hypothetical protein
MRTWAPTIRAMGRVVLPVGSTGMMVVQALIDVCITSAGTMLLFVLMKSHARITDWARMLVRKSAIGMCDWGVPAMKKRGRCTDPR